MTNGERIRNMSDSELAVFLEELDAATWDGAFYEEVCGLCARNAAGSVPCSGEDCPYGNSCEWWLSQPVKECKGIGNRYKGEHN